MLCLPQFDIEGYTKFVFPGRGDRYSAFKWNFNHFTGSSTRFFFAPLRLFSDPCVLNQFRS